MSVEVTKVNNEFHPNGLLAYTETIVSDGQSFFRIGTNAKYFDNGQLAWALNYDSKGNLIKDGKPCYRKDGSVITH